MISQEIENNLFQTLNKSSSIEIENFINCLKVQSGLSNFKYFTKNAFVQYRKKIQPEVFKKLSSILIDEFYTNNDAAINGSSITLPCTKELKKVYGETKNQTNTIIVQARTSVLYDVLNNYVLNGTIPPKSIGERTLALEYLKFSRSKDFIIYNRGYPGYDFIEQHCQRKIDF